MAYGLSDGHVTDDVTWPQRCCEAVRSAILATAWLIVTGLEVKCLVWSTVQRTKPRPTIGSDISGRPMDCVLQF